MRHEIDSNSAPIVADVSQFADLRAVIDHVTSFIAVYDLDGTVLDVNQPILRAIGLSRREVIGAKFWDLACWNYDEDVLQSMREAFLASVAGTQARLETEFKSPAGSIHFVDLAFSPILDANGCVARVVASGIDITDRKFDQARLSDAISQLELSLEVSNVATWNWNMESDCIISNPTLNRMFGFDPSDRLVLADFVERIDEDARSRVSAAIEETMKHGVPYDQEYPIRLRNGELRHIRAVGKIQRCSETTAQQFNGVVIDVTDRTHRELETVRREAHLRRVINNQLGLVSVIDRDGILLEVDDRSLSIAKARREEVIGKHFAETPWWNYSPAVAQQIRDAMNRAFAGEIVRYDVSMFSHGDDGVMIDFMLAPVFDDKGAVEYLISSGVDIRDRFAAEREMRNSETRFRVMADGLPLLIWVHDKDGKQTAVNQAFCDFYNVEESKMRGLQWQKLAHPDDFKPYTEEFARCVAKRIPFHAEVRVKRADGKLRWLESWGQPHFSDTGEYLGHIGASADVTDRKQQQFALQFTTELQAALDPLTSSSEIARVAAERVCQWLSPARCSLIRFDGDGEHFEIFHERTREDLASHVGRLHIRELTCRQELESLRSDQPVVINNVGRITPADRIARRLAHPESRSISILPYVSENALKYALCVESDEGREWKSHEIELLREVTERIYLRLERVRAEEQLLRMAAQLHESNEQLALATLSAKMGMFDWNVDRDTVAWDERHLELTGMNDVPPLGRNFLACIHPDDVEANNAAIERALREGSDYNIEFRFCRPDGQVRWLAAGGRVVQGADGCRHFIGLNWDVTDRRQIEESLEQARQAAEAANASKSEFLANMSHEIRTPMTAILGYAELLEEHVAEGEATTYLNTIRRNGNYLLEIINDILDLSKIEARKFEVEKTAFDPRRIIEDVFGIMQVRASDNKLTLTVEYEGRLPRQIQSDAKRLKQILINLVGNAIKFTPYGSVCLRVHYADEMLHFDVSDTGIGISEETMERLFKPFSQGDTSVTRTFGGTGLGLAISQRLAEMLGGKISAKSTEGVGSTFTISVFVGTIRPEELIDYETQRSPTDDKQPLAESNIQLNCHVLVVDDRRDIRFLSRYILSKAGATVDECEDGQQAVDHVEHCMQIMNCPDLILLDMQMPNLDGYQTAQQLRSLGYRNPILALTADAMQGNMNQCMEAGCNDYLSKPIDIAKLLTKVAHLTANQH